MMIDTAITPVVGILVTPGEYITKGQWDTLTAVVPAGPIVPTYQWFINGGPVPGAINAAYISNAFNDGDSVTVQITATTQCGSRSTFNSVIIHVSGGVSVGNVKGAAAAIQLMPNPNKGDFTVKGSLGNKADEEVTMELTDVLGQVVYKSKVMSRGGLLDEQIHLSSTVANGMYVLSLKTTTENKVFHVVIEQ